MTTVYIDLAEAKAIAFILPLLSTHCPHLRHLVLSLSADDFDLPPLFVPPTLTHLGLYFSERTDPLTLRTIFARVAEIEPSDAHLEVVRLLDPESGAVKKLRKNDPQIWSEGIKKWKARGWIVQDWEGKEIDAEAPWLWLESRVCRYN